MSAEAGARIAGGASTVLPQRWPRSLPGAFLLALIVAAGLRAFSFGTTGLDWDESVYIVIAQQWLNGAVPYRDIWDLHPMGVPGLFALATWLVGDGLLAARLAALVAVAATATLLYGFLDRHAGRRLAGLLAGLFYLLYMTRPDGLAANTEIFNNLAVTAASFLLFGAMLAGPARVHGRIFAAALLLGIGLQLKYVVIPEAIALCGTVLLWQLAQGTTLRRTAELATAALAGGVLPTAAMTLYFWQAGALQPYLDASLRANVAYLQEPVELGTVLLRLRYGLLPIVGLLPWPVVLVLLRRRWADQRLGIVCLWLTIWLLAAGVDVAVPLKFWKHYFNALVPPLSLIAGLALVLLARGRRAPLIAAVMLTAAPAVALMIKHAANSRTIDRVNVPLAIGERIKAGGTDGHDVYVFDYDPLVYAYAAAVPPTRFVLGIELSEFTASAGTNAEAETGRILAGRPRWIVVAQPSPYTFPESVWRGLEAVLRDYRLEATFREADYIQPPIEVALYRRVPALE